MAAAETRPTDRHAHCSVCDQTVPTEIRVSDDTERFTTHPNLVVRGYDCIESRRIAHWRDLARAGEPPRVEGAA